MLKHISKRRLFFLGLLHRWYLFVYFCVYVAISLSDFLWFTILPQLTTVRVEPAGRSWSAQARQLFAAPWTLHKHAGTVCSLMGKGTIPEAHSATYLCKAALFPDACSCIPALTTAALLPWKSEQTAGWFAASSSSLLCVIAPLVS